MSTNLTYSVYEYCCQLAGREVMCGNIEEARSWAGHAAIHRDKLLTHAEFIAKADATAEHKARRKQLDYRPSLDVRRSRP